MANFETFKLSELRLDENNYRTGPVSGQRAAIHAIIADQGQKLVNLGKDILEMGGLSPGEPLWVYREDSSGTYVVVEGNRRITALKLMDNPLLADGTIVERDFRALSSRFAGHPIREIWSTDLALCFRNATFAPLDGTRPNREKCASGRSNFYRQAAKYLKVLRRIFGVFTQELAQTRDFRLHGKLTGYHYIIPAYAARN